MQPAAVQVVVRALVVDLLQVQLDLLQSREEVVAVVELLHLQLVHA